MAIAVDQRHGFKPAVQNRRCRLRSFPYPDMNLFELDQLKPSSAGRATGATSSFHRSFSSPCWTSSGGADEAFGHIPRLEIIAGGGVRGLHALVVEAAIAMAAGTQLVPVTGGHGGAFRLSNRGGESFAVLKPITEDPQESLSFRRYSPQRPDAGVREVAAFILDRDRFSGVPPTALVKLAAASPPWTVASIQRFVPHHFDAGDLGPSRFSVSSVHRIGILDVRLLNIDRHAGNILVKTSSSSSAAGGYGGYGGDDCELVPIDHGLCLPEQLDDPYFEWLHWPQSSVPFSEQELEYITSLDPFRDAELLRSELPMLREESIRILILCTVFLKSAAAAGLCLADVGEMMTREFCGVEEGPSKLESLCRQAAKTLEGGGLKGEGEEREFQFELEVAGDGEQAAAVRAATAAATVEVPPLLKQQRKPPKVPKKSTAIGKPSSVDPPSRPAGEDDGGGDPPAAGCLTKSMSFCVSRISPVPEEGYVSFRGTSEEQWRLFLEAFEELLPAALEGRKRHQGPKPRLGTSCSF
ncbi:unnamed protein product [Spirodela intermedia]|uniref:1-phosphatidylinositol 4-kinase n=1 Tax=Spirodela intermedia TaxID=51605 RepID=A0A7I8JXF7_SPIIN|nr:unnamed protein product [Spirodela intermedia]